jgi:hypothetical protein
MRLEHLCDMELAYEGNFLLIKPYGTEEGTGFGRGAGTVTGHKLHGSIEWVNHPHRRSDSTMLPNTHGVIHTGDGALVMFTFSGRTVFSPDVIGGQLLTMTLEAEDERYSWLNSTLCVVEGRIEKGAMRARVFSCINELI